MMEVAEGARASPPRHPRAGHAAFFILLIVATGLLLAFTAQGDITGIGDDSVSYLALARGYAGHAGPALAPWIKFQAHFPPLFPLLLAATGGTESLRVAHAVVALFAALGIALTYLHAMQRFGRSGPALAVTILFLLAAGAWISVKGILSESLYLSISLAALCVHARWLERGARAPMGAWIAFGLLLALGWLTRTAGIALPTAFAVHAALRLREEGAGRRWRLAVPLVTFAIVAVAWSVLRPMADTGEYGRYVAGVAESWKHDPSLMMQISAKTLWYAWLQNFALDSDISPMPKIVLGLVAVAAVGGSIRRALANGLDGWYVLAMLGMISIYVVGESDVRRFFYPLLPLLLAHATGLVLDIARRLDEARQRRIVLAAAALAIAVVCVPAMMLVATRALDTAPLVTGGRVAAADIADYYTTLNGLRARAIAAREAAVIEGFGRLAAATPPDAKILWVRPEYVALLGGRQGVPSYSQWNEREQSESIRASGVTHVVLATLFKTDLHGQRADPLPVARSALAYSDAVLTLKNAVTGQDEFVLLKVDPARLTAYLGR